MKNFLVIENQGEIIVEDLILFGSSSKRGDDTKIGQFGSGNKYALPKLIREGCTPIIYSGTKELKVETKRIDHRGFDRDVIFIDGKDSSITTDAGPKWDMWMALREIYSNAIDEGGEKFYTTTTIGEAISNKKEGRTLYIIPINGQVREVVDNFEKYFAFDLTPSYISVEGFVYEMNEGPLVTYRKGIRCIRNENSNDYPKARLSFNFNNVEIEEDRIADLVYIKSSIRTIMTSCNERDIWKKFVMSMFDENFYPHFSKLSTNIIEMVVSILGEMVKEGYKFSTKTIKSLVGDSTTDFKESITIPSSYYQILVLKDILVDPLGLLTSTIDIPHVLLGVDYPEVKEKLEKMFPMLDITVSLAKYETYTEAYTKRIQLFDTGSKTPVTILIKAPTRNELGDFESGYVLKQALISLAKSLPDRAFSEI